MTGICEQYHAEVLKAEGEGVELRTQPLEEEFLSLVDAFLGLGSEGEEVVGIKEWERDGTMTTLKTKALFVEDLKTPKERRGSVEEDNATFKGRELQDALPDTHTSSAPGPPARAWSMELPVRNSPTPGIGV